MLILVVKYNVSYHETCITICIQIYVYIIIYDMKITSYICVLCN